MSNERTEDVLAQVANLADELHDKIIDQSPLDAGKRVIGFGFFVYHEDGTIATDVIGYWDCERVQARMQNFLQQFSLRENSRFSAEAFKVDENNQPTLTNEQARPALWKGF